MIDKLFEFWLRECVLEGSIARDEIKRDALQLFQAYAENVDNGMEGAARDEIEKICSKIEHEDDIWEEVDYGSK